MKSSISWPISYREVDPTIRYLNDKKTTARQRDTSAIMRKVRGKNTAPEIAFRKALWARGHRYRLHPRNLPGKPDLAFPGRKTAVFIDGDYWHGGQFERRGFASLEDQLAEVSRRDYWIQKIRGNMRRDAKNMAKLFEADWRPIRFWESSLKCDTHACIEAVERILNGGDLNPTLRILAEKSIGWRASNPPEHGLDSEVDDWKLADTPNAKPTVAFIEFDARNAETKPSGDRATKSPFVLIRVNPRRDLSALDLLFQTQPFEDYVWDARYWNPKDPTAPNLLIGRDPHLTTPLDTRANSINSPLAKRFPDIQWISRTPPTSAPQRIAANPIADILRYYFEPIINEHIRYHPPKK